MSAGRRRSTREAHAGTVRLHAHTQLQTLDLEGLSSDSLYAAIDKAAWIAMSEGWHSWRLVERGRVIATGDEHGPR